ncbi:VOC family protein [Acidaminobacter sp. JC074]|uniref:VOC family protein n=1 Tax=Acidaminobacter sp. JC074 TaxID=2530199 RepID=UPI001F104083|nr:VOC family protein [Acidaminobacter sp. JC074]MCH4888508.1 VOC family protein [Acidaminobacter sp. JC074]
MHCDLINFYRVEDLEKTRTFYTKMGLKLYKDQGKCLIFDAGFGKLGFCNHFPSKVSDQTCITFVYDSRQAVDEMAKILGGDPPTYNDYFKIYHFFLNDPNGIKLEFQVFEE